MAKRLTTILYASAANIAGLAADLKPVRAAGRPVRLIALEEFRGETEQNAGAIFVERKANDEVMFNAVAQAYPHLEVQDYSEGVLDVDDAAESPHAPRLADDAMRDLRMRLINAGGSAPANASAEELANLIAAQETSRGLGDRVPVLPTPATAGTVIPDSTPVAQRIGADALVSESAVATSGEALDKAVELAGEGSGETQPGSHSPTGTDGATQVAVGGSHSTFSEAQRADLSKVTTHSEIDAIAKQEGVDLTGKTKVADKIAAVQSARDAKDRG